MKRLIVLLVSVIVLAGLVPSFAQVPREGMAMKIAQVRKENAALMRHYTWNSRTELSKEAEVKDILIELISYGPDGQVRRSLLNDMKAPLPRGFLRRAIAEKERQKMEDYLTGLRSLLDQYTLPTAGKILDFVSQANIPPLDASGLMHLNGSSVVVPGDSLSVSLVAATLQTSRMEATTFYKGDMVQVTATFKTLQGGPTYMDYGEANVPAQELSLKVQNYDFHQVTFATPQVTEQRPPSPPPVAPAPAPATGVPLQTIEQKLRDLKALLDQGLISQSDYDAKKAQILQGL
jgi:hypothetical protein